jgi:hypothetical protein
LFDCEADPYELNNIADKQEYQEKLSELSAEMDKWLADIGDQPNLDEAKLIEQLWSGKDIQPVTSEPIITSENGLVNITCKTEGASIGYKIVVPDENIPETWQVYQGAMELPKDSKLMVQAHRIGFVPSEVVQLN